LLLLTITLGSSITACSDDAQNKAELEKYAAAKGEKAKHKLMPAEEKYMGLRLFIR